jgi:hypothetical protein
MITSLGWGVIATIIVIALTIGEICIVKDEYQSKVAMVSMVLQATVAVAFMLGTEKMNNFAIGQILTYVGLFLLVGAWVKISEKIEKFKEKRA